MIFTLSQILGALSTVVGSYALFGPWWTMLVFGVLTTVVSAIGEARTAPAPARRRPLRLADDDADPAPPGIGELQALKSKRKVD